MKEFKKLKLTANSKNRLFPMPWLSTFRVLFLMSVTDSSLFTEEFCSQWANLIYLTTNLSRNQRVSLVKLWVNITHTEIVRFMTHSSDLLKTSQSVAHLWTDTETLVLLTEIHQQHNVILRQDFQKSQQRCFVT